MQSINKRQYWLQIGIAIVVKPDIKRQTLFMVKAVIRIFAFSLLPEILSESQPNSRRPQTFAIPIADKSRAAFPAETYSSPSGLWLANV